MRDTINRLFYGPVSGFFSVYVWFQVRAGHCIVRWRDSSNCFLIKAVMSSRVVPLVWMSLLAYF